VHQLGTRRGNTPAGPSGPGKSAIVLALLRFTDSGLGSWPDQLGDGLGTVLALWDHPDSGAEMQRLGQARAMLTGRPVLLLDEPASHLDLATADVTLMAMLERTGQRAVLWVTHRAAKLAAFPDVADLTPAPAQPGDSAAAAARAARCAAVPAV
jgi:ABC-type multidrug transport system fused ATPase/permease subunit